MPTDAEYDELVERVDNLATRLGTMSNVAAQHGERHADRGEDPIEGELVTGHTHGAGKTPVVETTAVTDLPGGSTSITLASGATSPDLHVVWAAVQGNRTLSWPSDWTEFFQKKNGTSVTTTAAYRESDGSEGSTVVLGGMGGATGACIAYRISGARTGQAAVALEISAGATGSATGAMPNPDSLAPSGGNKNYLWLVVGGIHATGDFTAAPTNYSNFLNIEATGGGTLVGAGSAEQGLNASVEDPGTFTSTAGLWVAATIAVYPDETSLHDGSADVHHNSFVGLQDNADSTIDPEDDDRIKVTDDGKVNADKSSNTLALSITESALRHAMAAKTANYTAAATDTVIICNATSASFTITLPVGVTGKEYYIKKIDSSANTVTVAGAETIDDGTTAVLTVQYEAITIVSDGAVWWIV